MAARLPPAPRRKRRPAPSPRTVIWTVLLLSALYSLSTLTNLGSPGGVGGLSLRLEPLLSPEDMAADADAAQALLAAWPPNKPRAAFFVLTRNKDLEGVKSSMEQLEKRFNGKAGYPYIFVNERPFSKRFKQEVSRATASPCFFGLVPTQQWSYPPHINQTRAAQARAYLADVVPYGGSDSYRFMCRYFSGFFFRHPLLEGFEYYWRVEPRVKFFCDMSSYDPFVVLRDSNASYGFNIIVTEVRETIPSLWKTVRKFLSEHPQYVSNSSALPAMVDTLGAWYNGCHYWSNFEVGRLSFFRSRAYLDFFEALDQAGGFFYERWGDAPVHSLAAAALLPREAVVQLEVGYQHDAWLHCPAAEPFRALCDCDPKQDVSVDQGFCPRVWADMMDGSPQPLPWLGSPPWDD